MADAAGSGAGGSAASSWLPVPEGCDWTIHNIPFGVFRPSKGAAPRCGTIIGDTVRVRGGGGSCGIGG